MTGAEIQAIIASSVAAKVREINVPGLRLVFGEGEPAKLPQASSRPSQPTKAPVPAMTDKQHAQQTKDSIADDEARVKEERLSLMAIEDPLEYERLVTQGELQEATEDDDEALDQ